ncbi:MAG: transposase [bacterium]
MWTYDELFQNIRFNLLVRMALGLDDLVTMPFCPATLFNFQNRLNDHFIKTGENLLEQVFDGLTEKQSKALKLKTNIQRTDSTFAASNIRNYSRLQLLVEMIIRIYRVLSESDKERFREHFDSYVKKTSGQYIYTLNASDIPHELEKIAQLYFWIDRNIKPAYSELSIFKTFERVYGEHFTELEETIEVKSRDDLHSGCLQSPDDLDATYREKNGKKSKGQTINVVETANPENPINLITDVCVNPNNKDDSKNLNKRIDRLKEKTPDLDELHSDGAYGSSDNDQKFEEHNITQVQSDVRGSESAVPIEIDQTGEDEYIVSCPYQKVSSQESRKRLKAEFDLAVCQRCDKQSVCSSIKMKKYRTIYFTRADYLRKKRLKQRASIPADRLKIRNNVEATIHEFVCKMPKGKLKVRGAFKASIFVFSVAMSINFGRIYRYIQDNPDIAASLIIQFVDYFKERFTLSVILGKIFNPRYHYGLLFASV